MSKTIIQLIEDWIEQKVAEGKEKAKLAGQWFIKDDTVTILKYKNNGFQTETYLGAVVLDEGNSFSVRYTSDGFTEVLRFKGKVYTKRYKKDEFGYEGMDMDWEYEKDLPDNLVMALFHKDDIQIMKVLEG